MKTTSGEKPLRGHNKKRLRFATRFHLSYPQESQGDLEDNHFIFYTKKIGT